VPEGLLKWTCGIQRKILRRNFSRDTQPGYAVWRSRQPWEDLGDVAKLERPDVIVVMAVEPVRMALAAKRTGIPLVMHLQDVEFQRHGGDFEDLGSEIPCVANSRFTADKYRNAYGVGPRVIYPFIAPDRYRTETTRENVTFINPMHAKGREIAVGVAKLCPGIPFAIVESWPLPIDEWHWLMDKLSALPNAKFLSPQKDMRKVYGKCKILLAPSIWEEGYGRVVTEAQVSGIPAVVSNRGGLPEAAGPGGIILDPERPIGDWAAAVRKLWSDEWYYAEFSAAARAYAARPQNSLSEKLARWEQALSDASNGSWNDTPNRSHEQDRDRTAASRTGAGRTGN
jgi:glycosyltransferase involved in cell wall biosynthesis